MVVSKLPCHASIKGLLDNLTPNSPIKQKKLDAMTTAKLNYFLTLSVMIILENYKYFYIHILKNKNIQQHEFYKEIEIKDF